MIKGAIKMLRDVLCEQEMIGYLDDEYRRQLEVTGEALIDYLEAKNNDAPQYRNLIVISYSIKFQKSNLRGLL